MRAWLERRSYRRAVLASYERIFSFMSRPDGAELLFTTLPETNKIIDAYKTEGVDPENLAIHMAAAVMMRVIDQATSDERQLALYALDNENTGNVLADNIMNVIIGAQAVSSDEPTLEALIRGLRASLKEVPEDRLHEYIMLSTIDEVLQEWGLRPKSRSEKK